MEELYEISVSLITCSPGTEVWANYGHTAIRVQDPSQGFDYTFNYGLFSFDTPNFIWRFCTGETDYCVGAFDTGRFLSEYKAENRQVTQQKLNLTSQEALAIKEALIVNCRPENRFYRYNFFYDNCATRVRDMVERNVSEQISYEAPAPYANLREVLNFYTADYPWTGFGISLVLGPECDVPSSLRYQTFAPEILQASFANATLRGEPLVGETTILCPIDPSRLPEKASAPGPQLTMWTLFALGAAATLLGRKHKRHLWGVDIALSAILGIAGLVIGFLVFFSEHPATSPNWLLIWLNPLPFIYAAALCFSGFRNSRKALWCSAFWLLPLLAGVVCMVLKLQFFHPAVLPLLLLAGVRSAFSLSELVRSRRG